MRRALVLAFVSLLLLGGAPPVLAKSAKLRVLSFNIRFDFERDGENRWEHRRELVARRILESQASLVCLQEDKRHQVDDLKERLPEFEFLGRGRNATGSGERCSILFKRRSFQLRDSGDFWLSDTPDTPGSNTWKDRYPRKVTWALLEARKGKKTILVLNTHLPEGDKASSVTLREKGVGVIQTWLLGRLGIQEGRAPGKRAARSPVILTGDFNSDASSEPLVKAFLESPSFPLRDTWTEAPPGDPWPGTYGGFEGRTTKKRIDWLLVGGAIRVHQAGKLNEPIDGRYPSDHYAIFADLEVR